MMRGLVETIQELILPETNGDEVVSAISGKVTTVSEDGNLGRHLKIENEKFQTVYAHCSEIKVEAGTEVQQACPRASPGRRSEHSPPFSFL